MGEMRKLLCLHSGIWILLLVGSLPYSTFSWRLGCVVCSLVTACLLRARVDPRRICEVFRPIHCSRITFMNWICLSVAIPMVVGMSSVVFATNLSRTDWFDQSYFFLLPKDLHQLSHWALYYSHEALNISSFAQRFLRIADVTLCFGIVLVPAAVLATYAWGFESPSAAQSLSSVSASMLVPSQVIQRKGWDRWGQFVLPTLRQFGGMEFWLSLFPLLTMADRSIANKLTWLLLKWPLLSMALLTDAFIWQVFTQRSSSRGCGLYPAIIFRAVSTLIVIQSSLLLQGHLLWLWRILMNAALCAVLLVPTKRASIKKFGFSISVMVCVALLAITVKFQTDSQWTICHTESFSAVDDHGTLTMWCPWQNIYSDGHLIDYADYSGKYTEYSGPVRVNSSIVHTYCRVPLFGFAWHAENSIAGQAPMTFSPKLQQKCRDANRSPLVQSPHLVMNLFDSVDLLRMVHSTSPLPLTMQAFQKLRAVSKKEKHKKPLGVYHFPFVHTLGPNTMPNMIPLLTGQAYDADKTEVLEGCEKVLLTPPVKGNSNLIYDFQLAGNDCMAFLWTKLKCAGYALAWYDDICPREPYDGRFFDRAVCNYGFCQEHIFDQYLPDLGCYRAFPMLYADENKCAFGSTFTAHSLKSTMKLLQQYQKRGIPAFSMQSSIAGHTRTGFPLKAEDANIADYLLSLLAEENAAWFANSISIFFADHGTNYGIVQRSLATAGIELVSHDFPVFILLVGETVLQKYPDLDKILEQNRRGIYTFYDIHQTLLELLQIPDVPRMSKEPPAGNPVSLLQAEAWKVRRSCAEAGVLPDQCESWELVQSIGLDQLPTHFPSPYRLDLLDLV